MELYRCGEAIENCGALDAVADPVGDGCVVLVPGPATEPQVAYSLRGEGDRVLVRRAAG